MNESGKRLDRVERALSAAYRSAESSIAGPSEPDVWRIMLRVRAAAREQIGTVPGDLRFLWRFVSAGMVAAGALLVIALSDLPVDAAPQSAADDMIVAVVNPTLPF